MYSRILKQRCDDLVSLCQSVLQGGAPHPGQAASCVANCIMRLPLRVASGTSSAAAYYPASREAWGEHWVDAEHGGRAALLYYLLSSHAGA